MSAQPPIQFFDRRSGHIQTETVLGGGLLSWAYTSPFRHLLRWPLFGIALPTRLSGLYADSGLSRRRIAATVAELGINMDECLTPDGGFRSFNDFFCRRLRPGARSFQGPDKALHSPADCRLLVFPTFSGKDTFTVKGVDFTAAELLGKQGADIAPQFEGGALCICRLCPADYHRYHFPADGTYKAHWRLRGHYHSVNPLALSQGLKVFTENVRRVALLELSHFCLSAFIEVGAFGVASINETFQGSDFSCGQEKGYFTFGGSTIILMFQPGVMTFSDDLVANSAKGLETRVLAGDIIGAARSTHPSPP